MSESTKKCPNCGATISGMVFVCPECGYSFSNESQSSRNVNSCVERLQAKLIEAEDSISAFKQFMYGDGPVCQKKVSIISTFRVPMDIESLTEMLIFTYH